MYKVIDSDGYVWAVGDDQDEVIADLVGCIELAALVGACGLRVERNYASFVADVGVCP